MDKISVRINRVNAIIDLDCFWIRSAGSFASGFCVFILASWLHGIGVHWMPKMTSDWLELEPAKSPYEHNFISV
jgi:hypothetical protein